MPEEPVSTYYERAAAIVRLKSQIGKITERYGLAVNEAGSNGPSSKSDDFSGSAIATGTSLKEVSPNAAGIEKAGLTLEGHADWAGNRTVPQQFPQLAVITRRRKRDLES